MIILQCERTSAEVILYALYLFGEGKRSHVAVWKWVQRFNPIHLYRCKRIPAFLIDETMIQIGYSEAWLWVVVEPIHKQLLGVYISRHTNNNMIVAEAFLNSLIKIYGKHTVYSDGGTWYPEACASLGLLKHRLHSSYEKSIVERTIEYLKDRTEAFDDYFPCIRRRDRLCNLQHVHKWLILFVFMHNNGIIKFNTNFINLWR
jgi:putative transposase